MDGWAIATEVLAELNRVLAFPELPSSRISKLEPVLLISINLPSDGRR